MVQWLGLPASNVGGLGSIPGRGTRAHVPQLRPGTAKLKQKKPPTTPISNSGYEALPQPLHLGGLKSKEY